MRSVGSAMATLSVGVLAAGLLWPHLATTFLQALIAVLALAYLGACIHRARLPAELSTDHYSPFDRVAQRLRRPTSPPAIGRMAAVLQATADPEVASRASIPRGTRSLLAVEASRRLAEHHGLSLLRAGDRDRIRARVSDATWTLLGTTPGEVLGEGDPGFVPMSLLETILDDVERL